MSEHFEICRYCSHDGPHRVTVATSGVHHSKAECGKCGRFLRWFKKPEDDPTKYRRPQQHQNLVSSYGQGFCEMCLRSVDELPKGQTLEAQHVREYQDGGSSNRENIWIICTACHRLIHWVRTYRTSVTLQNQSTEMLLSHD